jgi:hypothetical protein
MRVATWINDMKTKLDSNILAWDVLCIDQGDAAFLENALVKSSHTIYRLDASGVKNEKDFIRHLVLSLPCNPSYFEIDPNREPCWDAVNDSLGDWPSEINRIGILWFNCDHLVEQHLNLLLQATDTLQNIATHQKKYIHIFLLGWGTNFSLIPDS